MISVHSRGWARITYYCTYLMATFMLAFSLSGKKNDKHFYASTFCFLHIARWMADTAHSIKGLRWIPNHGKRMTFTSQKAVAPNSYCPNQRACVSS